MTPGECCIAWRLSKVTTDGSSGYDGRPMSLRRASICEKAEHRRGPMVMNLEGDEGCLCRILGGASPFWVDEGINQRERKNTQKIGRLA